MSEVCHKCPLWKGLSWKDAPTGEIKSEWDCTDSWQFTGIVELAKMINRNTVTLEKFRNEVTTLNMAGMNAAARLQQIQQQQNAQVQNRTAPVLIEPAS